MKYSRKSSNFGPEIGQNVMCIHNKEMATVKFIGHTDFATGIWVGLEMKKLIGKNKDLLFKDF